MDDYQSLVAKGQGAYLDALSNIGWFDFPQNNKEEIEANLSRCENNEYFALSLSQLSFDAEGFESADEYKKVLYDMAKLAGIIIKSVELEYSFSEEGDKMNGKITTAKDSYWIEFENLIGWFDPELVDFINEDILAGENIEGRIFDLPAIDQFAQFVFVPRRLYDKAIENGIIPEDAAYFTDGNME